MKQNIVIIGGGNQAAYSIEIAEMNPLFRIIGVLDSVHELNSIVHGYPVIGRQEEIKEIVKRFDVKLGFIAIGDNWRREQVFQQLRDQVPQLMFATLVHPSVILGKNVKIGQGSLLMAGVIVNINSEIGDFGFLATGAQIDHDCTLEDFTSVSAGSVFGGLVRLKKYSAVTLGATVLDRLTIGENSVIGAGALVTKDIPDNVTAYGIPAKPIRKRELGEKFLK
jgi:sugar O-acyltransferase (sialic acid O-acetyltransferase NeuD family)